MIRYCAAALFFAVVVMLPLSAASGPRADRPGHGSQMGLYLPDSMEWVDGPPSLPRGAKVALLEGDPAAEGMFVMRAKLPDGYHVPPHTHPKTERVTVISGTLELAMGEQLTRGAAKPLPAGSFGYWPAGMKHAAWAKGVTIIQIHGAGPWEINYINPADDPRNAPNRRD